MELHNLHPRSPPKEKETVQAQKPQRNSQIAHKEGKERKKSKKYFANSPKKRTFAIAIRNDASKVDSLAQLVEHNTFNVGVLGSSPKRITKTNGKTKKTADNQSLSAVFILFPTCILGKIESVRKPGCIPSTVSNITDQSGKRVVSACLIIWETKSYSLLGCTISNRPPVRL